MLQATCRREETHCVGRLQRLRRFMVIVGGKNHMLRCDMLLVGLTGGLASGKTTIAQLFGQFGAKTIDADQITREVVRPRRVAWKDIVRVFGREVLTAEDKLNRTSLANIVFKDPEKLKKLTGILYPRVAREQARLTRLYSQENPEAVIIYDAAMLIESGAYKRMDEVIVVKAPQHIQIQRATRRSGMSKAETRRRLHYQLSTRQKLRYADHVIDGTLPRRELRRVVHELYRELREKAKQ